MSATYRDRELSSLLHGAQSARKLANRCRMIAQLYPRYEREEMAEAKRHFERACWYLDSVRMLRGEVLQ